MELDAKIPAGPMEGKWGKAPERGQARQSRQPPQTHRARRGLRPRGRVGRGFARRDGPTTSSASASRTRPAARTASPPRAGSTRPRTTRTTATAFSASLLRHGQGRGFPLPRGERLPPRADEPQHHRPERLAGRAVRARIQRRARQPLLRRRAGLAHFLRPRPNGPAAPARRLPAADAPGGRGPRRDALAPRDAGPGPRRPARPAA